MTQILHNWCVVRTDFLGDANHEVSTRRKLIHSEVGIVKQAMAVDFVADSMGLAWVIQKTIGSTDLQNQLNCQDP